MPQSQPTQRQESPVVRAMRLAREHHDATAAAAHITSTDENYIVDAAINFNSHNTPRPANYDTPTESVQADAQQASALRAAIVAIRSASAPWYHAPIIFGPWDSDKRTAATTALQRFHFDAVDSAALVNLAMCLNTSGDAQKCR